MNSRVNQNSYRKMLSCYINLKYRLSASEAGLQALDPATYGFLVRHRLFVEHGLHRSRFPARGAQGIQVVTADVAGMPITASNRAEMIAVLAV